jgi:O-antigen/teichoic acid export membrane protein
MRERIGYRLPFVLMLILGLFFLAQYFIPHPYVQAPKELMIQWKQPVNAFIIFVALFGLVTMHVRRVAKRQRRWGYSVVALTSMTAMIVVGLVWGIQDGTLFADWFKHLITPIESTRW